MNDDAIKTYIEFQKQINDVNEKLDSLQQEARKVNKSLQDKCILKIAEDTVVRVDMGKIRICSSEAGLDLNESEMENLRDLLIELMPIEDTEQTIDDEKEKETQKIELQISTKHEGTSCPWWFIADPSKCKPDVRQTTPREEGCENEFEEEDWDRSFHMAFPTVMDIALSIEGPFFSREEAETYLKARKYAYGSGAKVWCGSGYWSPQYKEQCKKIGLT